MNKNKTPQKFVVDVAVVAVVSIYLKFSNIMALWILVNKHVLYTEQKVKKGEKKTKAGGR